MSATGRRRASGAALLLLTLGVTTLATTAVGAAPAATPTPTPAAIPSPAPAATPTPTPAATPTAAPTATPTAAPSPTPTPAPAQSCGGGRWPVKTGTDADAGKVQLSAAPTPTSLYSLTQLATPATSDTSRVQPVETTVFTITATIYNAYPEHDFDEHLAIHDPGTGAYMIAELPDLQCIPTSSPFYNGVSHARSQLAAWSGATPATVTITGVGFFDNPTGQSDQAPNHIELHPILDLRFNPPAAPPSRPQAPGGVTAIAGNGAATLGWTAPLGDGGAPVSQYSVTASPGGFTVSVPGTARTSTVGGLVNGSQYSFTVTASNSAGPGPASAPSAAVIPSGSLPGAPTSVSVVGDDGFATVHWTPPVDTGGSAITGYNVVARPGGISTMVAATTTAATVRGLTNGTAYTFTVSAINASGTGAQSSPSNAVTPVGADPGSAPPPVPVCDNTLTQGYWLVSADGGIFPFGGACGFGGTGNLRLNQPIVGIARTLTGRGYWLVAADGGIFPFGDATGFGSTGGIHLNSPIVGIAATPDGRGYWLVAGDGGVFPFGDAGGFGSTGGSSLNSPIVGMAPTRDGRGYWLVAGDGGVFPFGDAGGFGSAGGIPLNSPVVGMAATRDQRGYWLVAGDGGVFPFGSARGYGSTGGAHLNKPIVGIAATADSAGYWLVASDGGIFPFGDAHGYGSTANTRLSEAVVAIAAFL